MALRPASLIQHFTTTEEVANMIVYLRPRREPGTGITETTRFCIGRIAGGAEKAQRNAKRLRLSPVFTDKCARAADHGHEVNSPPAKPSQNDVIETAFQGRLLPKYRGG